MSQRQQLIAEVSTRYYEAEFERDLHQVCGEESFGLTLSVASFVPDPPGPAPFSAPAARMRSLSMWPAFVISVFWLTLCDQARHSAWRNDLEAAMPATPKLSGLLGAGPGNMHPGYLLIVLSLERWGSIALTRRETEFRVIGKAALSPIASMMGPRWSKVWDAMRHGVNCAPDSIHPFVPYGTRYRRKPDYAVVTDWNKVVLDTLETLRA